MMAEQRDCGKMSETGEDRWSIHLNTFCGGMFKLNAKSDADSLLYSLSHFECEAHTDACSLNGIYHPHWLVQWSRHCSHMLIPVHSPWPAGYIDVLQTVLVIVTMAGLFLDRPHILNLCTFLCSMLICHSIDFTFSFSPCYIKIIEKYLR